MRVPSHWMVSAKLRTGLPGDGAAHLCRRSGASLDTGLDLCAQKWKNRGGCVQLGLRKLALAQNGRTGLQVQASRASLLVPARAANITSSTINLNLGYDQAKCLICKQCRAEQTVFALVCLAGSRTAGFGVREFHVASCEELKVFMLLVAVVMRPGLFRSGAHHNARQCDARTTTAEVHRQSVKLRWRAQWRAAKSFVYLSRHTLLLWPANIYNSLGHPSYCTWLPLANQRHSTACLNCQSDRTLILTSQAQKHPVFILEVLWPHVMV
eukprot:6188084-Pleurochrysis_carterae.AAC.1